MQHPRRTLAFIPLILLSPTLYLFPLHSHHCLMLLDIFLHFLLPLFARLPQGFSMEFWGLRGRSTKLLHFISSQPVDLICIQESYLNLSFSFRIPGFSTLRSNFTHSRSDIFSTDAQHANGCVIIFVRQAYPSLSFLLLSFFT